MIERNEVSVSWLEGGAAPPRSGWAVEVAGAAAPPRRGWAVEAFAPAERGWAVEAFAPAERGWAVEEGWAVELDVLLISGPDPQPIARPIQQNVHFDRPSSVAMALTR